MHPFLYITTWHIGFISVERAPEACCDPRSGLATFEGIHKDCLDATPPKALQYELKNPNEGLMLYLIPQAAYAESGRGSSLKPEYLHIHVSGMHPAHRLMHIHMEADLKMHLPSHAHSPSAC